MISSIQMQDVASYKTLAKLETDKKVNIIYGLNGTGKSTLSCFLYNPNATEYQQCSADVGEDEKVLVYNQQFIQDYFYEADSLKGVFSLSKENKEIEEKLKEAEADLESLTDEESQIRSKIEIADERQRGEKAKAADKTWEIKTQYTGGDRVLELFLTGLKGNKEVLFNFISGLEKPESKPGKDIPTIKKEVESLSGDSARPYDLLPHIEFNELETECNDVFSLIIVGNESSTVSELIKELNNSDWVRKGLEFMPTPEVGVQELCPFCQEKTITKVLAENIKNYFDESFDDSLNLISTILERYQIAAGQIASVESIGSHPLAQERLSELTLKYQILEKQIADNLSLIRRKQSNPSVQVQLVSTSTAVEELNEIIETINADVITHNERINNVESELDLLKSEFWSLMRWDYDQTIANWQSIDAACRKEIDDGNYDLKNCSNKIADKRLEITGLQKSTVNIEAAIESINEGLTQLGITDFAIAKHTDSLYRILRLGETEAEFTSLSEGEKMIISFLYFCEICKGKQSADETACKKIIVIDDPISSLSHIFVFNIAQLLKTEYFLSSLYEQVFVLTHSLYFFYELADSNHSRRKETQNLFRLIKNTNGSRIRSMKYEEVQNDYQSYWVIVTDKYQPPALIANSMRNIIEYFFNFVQKADLSNVIQKPELQENRYQAFCRYINRESHSLGQNIFDYKEFDYDDFREGFRLVFEVTGYPEHHEKMIKVLSEENA